MRYVLQKQKSKHYTPANNLFERVHKITQLSITKLTRCTVATTILNRLYISVRCQMGTACVCEVYETSSNLPFASFSRKSEIFTSRFTQIHTSWNLEKQDWGGAGLKNP